MSLLLLKRFGCHSPSKRASQSGSSGRPAAIHLDLSSFSVLSPVLQRCKTSGTCTATALLRKQSLPNTATNCQHVEEPPQQAVHVSSIVPPGTYCWATQLLRLPNCCRQAHAMEIDLVLQHSAYALASCLHFCIASCFIRNIKAAQLAVGCFVQ